MNEPIAKAELLATIDAEHDRLAVTLRQLSDEQLVQPGVEGDWSVKDLLAHITWWEQRLIQLLESAARGEAPPSLLLPGEDWDAAIPRLNDAAYAASRDRALDDVREAFERSFAQVVAVVSGCSEHDLFDPAGLNGIVPEAAFHMIAANTYEHYQEHRETIRAWIEMLHAP